MIGEKKLDTSGIQFLGIAQLISLCGGTLIAMGSGFLSLFMQTDAVYSDGASAGLGGGFFTILVEVAVLVLYILGLTRLSVYTESFKKARLYYIIKIAIGVAGGFLAVVILLIWVMTTVTASSFNAGVGMAVGIFFFVLVVDAIIAVGAWLKIKIVHHTAHGIQEMAVAAGENALVTSMRKMDRIYRIFVIICSAVLGVSLTGLGIAIYSLLNSYRSVDYMMGATVAVGAVGIVFIFMVVVLAAIVMLGIEIYVTVMYFKSAQRLRGKKVAVQTERGTGRMTLLVPLSEEAKEALRAKRQAAAKQEAPAEKPAESPDVEEKPAESPDAEEKPAAPAASDEPVKPEESAEPEATETPEAAESPEEIE